MSGAYTKHGIYGKCLEIFLGNIEDNLQDIGQSKTTDLKNTKSQAVD
jgi:hypothetical protein